MIFSSLKKQIASILLVSIFLFDFSFFFTPQTANALLIPPGVNLTEPVPGVPVSDAAIRNKEAGLTILGRTIPGLTWDSILILIVRTALEKLSASVVDWINDGPTDEGPLFAVNPEQFFRDVADNVAGDFIDSIGLGALCSPFRIQVEGALRSTYNASRIYSRDKYDAQCTLSDVVNNIDNFLDGDFNQGGWGGWFELTQRNANNPYSALVDAQANLSLRINSEQSVELTKLNWGDGFIEWSDCIEPIVDEEGNPIGCNKRGPTKTPGKVIEAQLNKTVSSEITQLELADEFDEIVSALVNRVGDLFMNRDGLITSSGNRRRPGIGSGTGVGGSLGGFCNADVTEGIAGQTVITWTVSVYVGGSNPITYSWSGEDGLSGSTAEIQRIYEEWGLKDARVTVTYTTDDGEVITTTIDCNEPVNISKFGPITAKCSPVKPEAYLNPRGDAQPMYDQQNLLPVGWRLEINGGSGSYARVNWDGIPPGSVRGGAIGNFPIYGFLGPYNDSIRWAWQLGQDNAVHMWPRRTSPGDITNNIPTVQVVVVIYDARGNMSAQVTIIDNDDTVKPITITCTPSILIYA